jgi:hypothetical protein
VALLDLGRAEESATVSDSESAWVSAKELASARESVSESGWAWATESASVSVTGWAKDWRLPWRSR